MNMLEIRREEVLPPQIYEKERDRIVKEIIEIKKRRRVSTRTFSFLFECKDTVLNQINEMVFIENVHDEEEIRRLIRVYSDLLPGRNELSVSMFIEFDTQDKLIREMPRLAGIEKHVYMTFGNSEIHAIPEEGRSTDTLESTLQYLRFRFTDKQLSEFMEARNVYIETRHPGYEESARIPEDLLETLKSELISGR
ncbi:hypothetical protein GCM10007108_00400 [Thermogymnomonas acidicola]|uniref:DUF3501 family protein n=2 Tax=Thermogymnomonas acidicola TaxID=399579 RepID=A0AA37BPP1_9ARCH|nr:hypothetical protein GCM10007108_00400 [Thermogymnomonas acidicola]